MVRAPGCGPGGRGFESHRPPHKKALARASAFFHEIRLAASEMLLRSVKYASYVMRFAREVAKRSSRCDRRAHPFTISQGNDFTFAVRQILHRKCMDSNLFRKTEEIFRTAWIQKETVFDRGLSLFCFLIGRSVRFAWMRGPVYRACFCSRYCFGVRPYSCLNIFTRLLASQKPHSSAISDSLFPFSSR